MNPYLDYVKKFAALKRSGKELPLGGFLPGKNLPKAKAGAGRALIFAPHPDDECIIGALPLRLQQEGMEVINVAVTQGSKKERQSARWSELEGACRYLGFGLIETRPGGLEGVNLKNREAGSAFWKLGVECLREILRQHQPRVIFFPHELDWNSTHIGTHWMIREALAQLPASFTCHLVETEFWGQMPTPNILVESSVEELALLVAATSFHVGEVERNPYHLLLPAWMQDNVRRGGELVGGQGQAVPDFTFGTLYRWQKWEGEIRPVLKQGRFLGSTERLLSLFGS